MSENISVKVLGALNDIPHYCRAAAEDVISQYILARSAKHSVDEGGGEG